MATTASSSARGCVMPTVPHMCAHRSQPPASRCLGWKICRRATRTMRRCPVWSWLQRKLELRSRPARSDRLNLLFVNILEPDLFTSALLPETFLRWFAGRGWSPREHQLALLAKARDDRSTLLIAPTGAGKTLAGFLPTLVELSAASSHLAPLAGRGRLASAANKPGE